MNIYVLGSLCGGNSIAPLLSKWNMRRIENEGELICALESNADRDIHFVLELSEVNEKKYLGLQSIAIRYRKKVKFVVFYQNLKPSPKINKLHSAEILLIGPEEREVAAVLLKRYFRNGAALFRRWPRYQLVTAGSLSLLSDPNVRVKTKILNFGPHGTELELEPHCFKKKDFVLLEYFSHDGKKIGMQSRIVWTNAATNRTQVGIQFISRNE